MTIIELMVATFILAVGILGTVTMIDTSSANTSKTKAREGATNLGRAVMEIARAVPFQGLTPAEVQSELEAHSGFEDSSGVSGYQIRSRNFTYTVTVDVCSLDDPKDRLGDHDEAIPFCADSEVAAAGATSKDRNPDDYRRVSIGMSWKDPQSVAASTKQTGVIVNPVGGLGPSVTSLDITGPVAGNPTITSGAAATFSAKTSVAAAYVNWSVSGQDKGQATGGPVNWAFSWNLDETKADGTLTYPDCTYVVQANAFDDKDRSGAPNALTVTLNRSAPPAPSGFEGGRNLNGSAVDLQWNKNRECDIVNYKVYRGTNPAAINTLVCTTAPTETECIDQTAPAPAAGQTLYYEVVAVDKDPSQVARDGFRSAPITIAEGNQAPIAPTALTACVGGNLGCLDDNGDSAPTGAVALSWAPSIDPDLDAIYFYRVYRGGNTYGDRYDVLFPTAGKPLIFIDSKPASGVNTYYVSAVDTNFGESALTGPVSVTP